MERESKLRSLLEQNFTIQHMVLENESHMHSVPENSETHFKLVLVTPDFNGKRKVARHQQVYALVSGLMEEGLHALALHTFTPDEWAGQQSESFASPNCMGGSKNEK